MLAARSLKHYERFRGGTVNLLRLTSPVVKWQQAVGSICNNKRHSGTNGGSSGIEVFRRRVLELGSGSIKCQVSDVHTIAQRIVTNLFTTNKTVLFTRDLKRQVEAANEDLVGPETARAFSLVIQQQGMRVIQEMLSETEIFQPDSTVAIATEAFRRASNGRQYAELLSNRCNIPVKVLPAQQEARLGFYAAATVSGASTMDLVSWDCGAGSFQLSTKSHGSHIDSQGSGTVEILARPLRARGLSPPEIVDILIQTLSNELASIPTSIQKAIRSRTRHVVAIGSQHSIFNQQRIVSGKHSFCQDDVAMSLREAASLDPSLIVEWELERSRKLIGGDDDDKNEQRCTDNAIFLVPKLALLLAVMRHANIEHVTFHKTNGNCDALLTQRWLWE